MRQQIFILLTLLFASNINAQIDHPRHTLPWVSVSYVGDVFRNTNGGLKTGNSFLGLTNIKLGFESDCAGLWKGGSFLLNAANTSASTSTGDLTGDFHGVSNIEAGYLTYMHELWFKQEFESFAVTAGLQDINTVFLVTENAGLFVNSSFGVPSTVADNVPCPIFPLTGVGLTAEYFINEQTTILAGLFDGNPTDFSNNRHNLNWELRKNDGLFSIAEIQIALNENTTIKTGTYYHSKLTVKDEFDNDFEVFKNNYGFYGLADLNGLFNNEALSCFAQLSVSPSSVNNNYLYAGAGIRYSGLFTDDDIIGFAAANAFFKDYVGGNETSLELTYRIERYGVFLQPDFQYIINPGGAEADLDNAFAVTMRFGFNFSTLEL